MLQWFLARYSIYFTSTKEVVLDAKEKRDKKDTVGFKLWESVSC